MKLATEHQEQAALIAWANNHPIRPIRLLLAIPNGGARSIKTGTMLKAEGVRPGVPDLFLPVARGTFHGLWIEMKRSKGGSVSEDQRKWIYLLDQQGYMVEVCKGFDAAKSTIENYMALS